MKRALGYTRVSSEEQGKSGFGLASQRAAIEGFADEFGYRIMSWDSDIASAIGGDSLRRRPGLQAVLNKAKRERRPIMVTRLDRISRDGDELEQIVRDSGIQFIIVDDSYLADPLVLNSWKAQKRRIERETGMLSSRTREGLARAKQEGRIFGNTKNLEEAQRLGREANRQNFLKRCRELKPLIETIRASGSKSAAAIANQLNERGILSSSGKPWTGPNLRRYLVEIDSWAKSEAEAQHHYKDLSAFGRF